MAVCCRQIRHDARDIQVAGARAGFVEIADGVQPSAIWNKYRLAGPVAQ
jgi:hypothetical protein